jgi:hypothetical protein
MSIRDHLLESEDEHERIMFLTDWSVQQQFHGLQEMFDAKSELRSIGANDDFSLKFYVKGSDYIFSAKETSRNFYTILFYKIGDSVEMFVPKKEKLYIGDIISGVFLCLKRLINDRTVDGFGFTTDQPELINFYDKLSKYIESRFDYKLYSRDSSNSIVRWTYRRK